MDYLCFAAVAPLRTNTEAIAFRTARTSSLASGSAFSTMSSEVKPSARLALTSAPSARSSSATALWPDSTAQCSGVCFRGLVSSGLFNCVPLAMCSRTAPTSPARAASQIEIAGGAVNLGGSVGGSGWTTSATGLTMGDSTANGSDAVSRPQPTAAKATIRFNNFFIIGCDKRIHPPKTFQLKSSETIPPESHRVIEPKRLAKRKTLSGRTVSRMLSAAFL